MTFKIGDFVSTHIDANEFVPGVGEIIRIDLSFGAPIYSVEHNGEIYHCKEKEIYEFDPY